MGTLGQQARPAFAVLAVVAAAAAATALASRARPRGTSRAAEGGDPSGADHRGTPSAAAVQPGPGQCPPSRPGPIYRGADQAGGEQMGRSWPISCPGCAGPCAGPRAPPTPPSAFRGPARAAFLHHRAPRDQAGPARPDAPAGAELVATLLGGLQSAGYVTRTPGADSNGDRRTVSLNLSEAGAQAVSRWHRVNADVIRAALAELPHRDRAALRDAAPALRDLTASIDAQAD